MVDAVFLGDSWLDDKWNEHRTWGAILAESEKWTYLNLSKAGCTTEYIIDTIKTHPGLKTRTLQHNGSFTLVEMIFYIGSSKTLSELHTIFPNVKNTFSKIKEKK